MFSRDDWSALFAIFAFTFVMGSIVSSAIASFAVRFVPVGHKRIESMEPGWWALGPGWIFVHLSMAISAFLVWQRGDQAVDRPVYEMALAFYSVQLALFSIWSVLFFQLRMIRFAMVMASLAIVVTLSTTIFFWVLRIESGFLMLAGLVYSLCLVYWNVVVGMRKTSMPATALSTNGGTPSSLEVPSANNTPV